MIKKFCALFVAVLIIVMSMTALVATAATPEYDAELLTNGGFETLNDAGTAAQGWSGFRTWGNGSVLSIVSGADNVHSGSYAAKFSTKAGDNPYFSQGGIPIVGKCKYKITFWYKGTTGGSGFSFKFVENGANYKEHYSSEFTTSTTWKKGSFEFYTQEGNTNMSINPRTYSEGTEFIIDDLSFKCIEGPEQFKMDTDWVFYYEEYNEATITITMDDFYTDSGYTVDLKISRGMTKPFEVKGLTFTNNKLVCKADITKLNKKQEYTLQATIRDSSGTPVKTLKNFIYRYNRPTNITKDGVFMMDGKPFEPVLAYHFDMNDAADAVRAGVNVIQWAPTNGTNEEITIAELDALHAAGLKASVVCYWGMQPAGHPNNQARIQSFIEMVKDHPAVFCYMIMDEPFSHYLEDEAKDYLRLSYKIIRSVDDKHPVYVCDDQPEKYATSAKYVDLLGTDPYPRNGLWESHVADCMVKAKAATRGEKPVSCLVQAFSWVNGTPSPDMLKTQLYQAMMGGANMVGYYTWVPDNPAIDQNLNVGRYWNTMLNFHDLEQPLLYSYFGRHEYETYNSYRGSEYWYDSWTDGNDIYYALVSRKSTAATAVVSLANSNGEVLVDGYDVTVINGDNINSVTKYGDNFSVEMIPYHAAMYKITPNDDDGYETGALVKNGDFETGAENGSTNITNWTQVDDDAFAAYATVEGNNVASMPPQSAIRQVVPIASWEGSGKNYGYIFNVDMNYNNGGYPSFVLKATFDDGSTVSQQVSVARSAEELTDEKSQVVATLWQWNTLTYDLSWMTQNNAHKLTSISIDLMGMGAGCQYDNVVLTQKEATKDVVTNGGFESTDAGWNLPPEGSYTDKSEAYEGNGALKITSEGNAFAVQSVDLKENRTYDLSLWAKGNGASRAVVKLEFNDADGKYMSAYEGGWDITSDWTQVNAEVTVPEGAVSANFMIRLIGGGTIYYDNVTLTLRDIEGANDPRITFMAGDTELTDIADLSGRITARGIKLDGGDKLYLALYKEVAGTDRLCMIETATAGQLGVASCVINENTDDVTKVKAFVWTKGMGTKLIKTLE